MTISLERQYLLAEGDQNFKERMTAACFNAARRKFLDDPSIDPDVQAKREVLINRMLYDPGKHARLFAWAIVSLEGTDEDNISDDSYLIAAIYNVFDKIATLMDVSLI